MLLLRCLGWLLLFFCLFACVPASQPVTEKRAQQAEVHYKLGVSHLQANNPTQALKELLIAVENGPKNAAIHASLAQAYQLKKAYPLAEKHYLQALNLSDNDPRYQNNLASLYLDMQQWDKAIDYFGKAASDLLFLNPHIALTGKGYAYFKKQDYPAAIQQFEEVINIAPRYVQAYYFQSEAYQAMGENEMARRALEKAVDIAPGFLQAGYQLGVMLMQDEQPEAARARFERIVELAPDSEWGVRSAQMLKALPAADSEGQ